MKGFKKGFVIMGLSILSLSSLVHAAGSQISAVPNIQSRSHDKAIHDLFIDVLEKSTTYQMLAPFESDSQNEAAALTSTATLYELHEIVTVLHELQKELKAIRESSLTTNLYD